MPYTIDHLVRKSEEFQATMADGPVAMITVHPAGRMEMGPLGAAVAHRLARHDGRVHLRLPDRGRLRLAVAEMSA